MQLSRKLILLTFTLMIAGLAQAAAVHYDANEFKRFNETNECVGCNLSNGSFSDHRKANLQHANLSGTFFSGDNTRSNYSYANGTQSAFTNGSEAKFNHAVLIDTRFFGNFTYADFTNANVQGANFADANLYGAKITDQQLKQAKSVCAAILPDGLKGTCR